eukprot:CAMPEP_0181315764 /NCGR_PEP_ID=MMETSP1101-20121128/15546_1 /TAXON_ID=46948 /ORGANISM="Rhodomonas abbreviata, Strain Caron Lab Isolate" /LENGTH=91 /DNA_ID=CAMNT_0023422987 /DNA_START=63 /DNA_END=338 /DNA_ORIENTATION=-
MSAQNKMLAMFAVGVTSATVVGASYYNEKVSASRSTNLLHRENEGVLSPQVVGALSPKDVAVARESAARLRNRNSGNYFGLMTGEYSEAKQ